MNISSRPLQGSSTDSSTIISLPTPSITVVPKNPDSEPGEWVEENPILTAVIIIGGLVVIILFMLCCIRYKRMKSEQRNTNSTTKSAEDASQGDSAPPQEFDRKDSHASIFTDSFVIIRSPSLSKRRESKPKRTLAVPPMFSVNHRKPSNPNPNQTRRATVHFARWSEAGVEIHAAGVLGENSRGRTASASAATFKPGETSEQSTSSGIPMLYRRVSQGQHHAIYAPESLKTPEQDTSKKAHEI